MRKFSKFGTMALAVGGLVFMVGHAAQADHHLLGKAADEAGMKEQAMEKGKEILSDQIGRDGAKAAVASDTAIGEAAGSAADATGESKPALEGVVDKAKDMLGGLTDGEKAAAPEAPAVSAPPPASRIYTVRRGDTLGTIADTELGSSSRYNEIYDTNRGTISDPNVIEPGQVLRMP